MDNISKWSPFIGFWNERKAGYVEMQREGRGGVNRTMDICLCIPPPVFQELTRNCMVFFSLPQFKLECFILILNISKADSCNRQCATGLNNAQHQILRSTDYRWMCGHMLAWNQTPLLQSREDKLYLELTIFIH